MPWSTFLIIFVVVAFCQCMFRVLPVAIFNERPLPSWLAMSLDYIPVATFAALVVNDLFRPEQFYQGLLYNLIPLVAAIPVILVARKSGSLLWCIVVGVLVFAALFLGYQYFL